MRERAAQLIADPPRAFLPWSSTAVARRLVDVDRGHGTLDGAAGRDADVRLAERAIVGRSKAMQRVLAEARQVAMTDSTALLLGETGTGKEVIATYIHDLSARRARSMVRVNCSAIPNTLIESELFGREKGAFTGAVARQIGRFELADRATIFLDEIGDLPADIQVKLLRVLEAPEPREADRGERVS
jgi:formate hydrogenlyase transcriptional activator